MYELDVTRQYLRDLKLARKRGLDEAKLDEIIKLLLQGQPLPAKYKDHNLIKTIKAAVNAILHQIGY